jgi:hypothetical protein
MNMLDTRRATVHRRMDVGAVHTLRWRAAPREQRTRTGRSGPDAAVLSYIFFLAEGLLRGTQAGLLFSFFSQRIGPPGCGIPARQNWRYRTVHSRAYLLWQVSPTEDTIPTATKG